jgi:hypothetical protein
MSYLDTLIAQEEEYNRLHEEAELETRPPRRSAPEPPPYSGEPDADILASQREARERDKAIWGDPKPKRSPAPKAKADPPLPRREVQREFAALSLADDLTIPTLRELDEDCNGGKPRLDLERQLADLERRYPGVTERARAQRQEQEARGLVRPWGVE